MQAMRDRSLVAVSSLREFFRDAFHEATEHQHLDIEEQSEQYVVNLLTMFSRADALYEKTPDGLRIRPLAHMLAEALEAPSAQARQRALQRLAYSSLADSMQSSASGRSIAATYAELSAKFQGLVDALNEVSEMSYVHTDADILRLYEIWMKTGSARAHGLLNRLGVQPVKQGGFSRSH